MNRRYQRRVGKLFIPLAVVLIILGLTFLPGPNGLISVLLKFYRINRLRSQIRQMKACADSLESEVQKWRNPDFATEQARQLLKQPQPDTIQ
ncbi:MAG: hypothetical protein N2248_04045 [candidate division WOR-3 bacterium]|uniref:Uncharacterized protein n=1 Tax=candidate division WOR-3 bacterium TaxID=2052148 RepID=A0A7C1NNT0_UNCW3|nr:hypothetical protein [candidate division WOR-3 bacterium]